MSTPGAGAFREWLAAVRPLLQESQRVGFLGPGPVDNQMSRSLAFADAVDVAPRTVADLGSGGGLPALVLLMVWPDARWSLIESNERRSAWLREAVRSLGADDRCRVLTARAEEAGRSSLRHSCDLVTARGFSGPGPTAECGAPLLAANGAFLVAGPPDDGVERWPSGPLGELGLVYSGTNLYGPPEVPTTITKLACASPTPERYPRRTGVPFKRPLF